MERAARLEKMGHTDFALDLLYDTVDELLRGQEFPRLDSILAHLEPQRYSVDILLGILTATLPARSRLPSRPNLVRESERLLRDRGDYEHGLLAGLQE